MKRPEAVLHHLKHPGIWLGGQLAEIRAESTGYPELNCLLPGHGWPVGALTELVSEVSGCGELSLLMPTLARLSQAGGLICLVNPPYIPYAPALRQQGVMLDRLAWLSPSEPEDALWAAEQTLRSGAASAVLFWTDRVKDTELRRLQLGAETGQALGFLYRGTTALKTASLSALRLVLSPVESGLKVEVAKARGGRKGASCIISSSQMAGLRRVLA